MFWKEDLPRNEWGFEGIVIGVKNQVWISIYKVWKIQLKHRWTLGFLQGGMGKKSKKRWNCNSLYMVKNTNIPMHYEEILNVTDFWVFFPLWVGWFDTLICFNIDMLVLFSMIPQQISSCWQNSLDFQTL